MSPRHNAAGVYEPDEHLLLPRATKGWRGCNLADIEIANLGEYWIWATSFAMHTGDCHGSASPLMDDGDRPWRTCRAPTREAAIDAAAAYLRECLTKRADHCTDARAVLAWLESLNPAQADLFGALAA